MKFPTTPRRYYTQKNYLRLKTLDKDMDRKRAFLYMEARINPGALDSDVVAPVVVHFFYAPGGKYIPPVGDARGQLDLSSRDFRQTAKVTKHTADLKEGFAAVNALDARISFCLATKDPFGKATTGCCWELRRWRGGG